MINKDLLTPLSLLFSQENMLQFKRVVNQFNDVFNDEFWESITRVNQLMKGKTRGNIPFEIWENQTHVYVVVLTAGIKDKQNIRIKFKDSSVLVLKVKYPLLKPVEDSFLVETEISRFEEREINLPQSVESNDYELELNEGILVLTLNKQHQKAD